MIISEDTIFKIKKEDIDNIKVIRDANYILNSDHKSNGVYFLHNGATLVKIGHSSNAKKRIAGLKTSSPQHLKLIGFIEVKEREGINVAQHIELLIHHLFDDFRYKGEWFLSKRDGAIFEDCVRKLHSLNFPLHNNVIKNRRQSDAAYNAVLDILSNSDDANDLQKIQYITGFLNDFYMTKLSHRMIACQVRNSICGNDYRDSGGGLFYQPNYKISIKNTYNISLDEAAPIIFSDGNLNIKCKLVLLKLVLNKKTFSNCEVFKDFLKSIHLDYHGFISIFQRLFELNYLTYSEAGNYYLINIDSHYDFIDSFWQDEVTVYDKDVYVGSI